MIAHAPRLEPYIARYREGTCRDRIMHDLILEDARRLGDGLTFLDIGCGNGFDTSIPLQQSLVRAAGKYIGVEPDRQVEPGNHIADVHRCFFEDVDIPLGSVDVAFAIMVLEHVAQPQPFWDKLHDVLVPGGVFWALTVDARHWFCHASLWTERLGVKDWYLTRLLGARGSERYENYPVHYQCNTPRQAAWLARRFNSVETFNLARPGQLDDYLPTCLRGWQRRWELGALKRGQPGTLLAIRAVK